MSTPSDRRDLVDVDVGHAAALAVRNEGAWMRRRVESLTFPDIEQLVIRRQISFDFIRPEGLARTSTDWNVPVWHVPLSLLRRWPPRIGIDLQSGAGDPLSLLSSREGDARDAGLLIGLAEHVIGPGRVSDGLIDRIESLTGAHDGFRAASDEDRTAHDENRLSALYEVLGLTDRPGEGIDPTVTVELREDPVFSSLAQALFRARVLWVPVTARPGERCLVKLTYDARRDITHDLLKPSSWAWVGLKVGFDVPDIGRSGTYHLDIAVPAPLLVKHARLELSKPRAQRDSRDPDREVFRERSDAEHCLREGLIIDERAKERHGSFYVEGDREVQVRAYVNLSVEKEDYVRGALLASGFVLALLVAFRIGMGQVLAKEFRGPAVTMLLFVPGLLGYLVVRPGEHWLAAGFLSGVRKLVVINAGLPLVAAAALILAGHQEAAPAFTWLGRVWALLMVVSTVTTLMLLASSFLPAHERWLDDLPRRRWAVWAAFAGLLVGIVNGISELFPWEILLSVMALPALFVGFFSGRSKPDEPETE